MRRTKQAKERLAEAKLGLEGKRHEPDRDTGDCKTCKEGKPFACEGEIELDWVMPPEGLELSAANLHTVIFQDSGRQVVPGDEVHAMGFGWGGVGNDAPFEIPAGTEAGDIVGVPMNHQHLDDRGLVEHLNILAKEVEKWQSAAAQAEESSDSTLSLERIRYEQDQVMARIRFLMKVAKSRCIGDDLAGLTGLTEVATKFAATMMGTLTD